MHMHIKLSIAVIFIGRNTSFKLSTNDSLSGVLVDNVHGNNLSALIPLIHLLVHTQQLSALYSVLCVHAKKKKLTSS